MTFNFDDLLLQGKSAADLVIQNNVEIKEVFAELEASLSRFLGLDITLDEEIEYEEAEFKNIFERRKETGYKLVFVRDKASNVRKYLMSIKRSADGYPIVVAYDRNQYVADDKNEFAQGVGRVISNAQVHLNLNAFRRNVAAEQKAAEVKQKK
ncbi:hypothetical protein KW453_20095 [Vibrio fluvialis]|nr:hypothetical protein [Vibrio fluvialis]MBY7980290.1 hypothetical protein [Vibrio fluvialis]